MEPQREPVSIGNKERIPLPRSLIVEPQREPGSNGNRKGIPPQDLLKWNLNVNLGVMATK